MRLKTTTFLLLSCLIGANLCLWGMTALLSIHDPVMLSTAFLAWVFGARHALDADHITAIDTITRRLMEQGKKPYFIGLYFSLGHSTIVILAVSLLIALPSSLLFQWLHERGSLIGGTISGGFLLIMGFLTARSAWQQYHSLKYSLKLDVPSGEIGQSFLSYSKGWQVIILGMLFGLGFDTASEIGLLSLTSSRHATGETFLVCLLLPLLFTGAMALVDSLDNLLMVRAWRERKDSLTKGRFYYRFNVTILSSFIALFIGGMELVSLFTRENSPILPVLNWCGDHAEELGAFIIILFLALWAGYSLYVKSRVKGHPARG